MIMVLVTQRNALNRRVFRLTVGTRAVTVGTWRAMPEG
jgi:hypothetical protein